MAMNTLQSQINTFREKMDMVEDANWKVGKHGLKAVLRFFS